jgi:predicted metal-dependent enzyme (double-stranded beta helix superfamily)
MNKLLYKPLSFGISALGGVLASVVFKQIWKRSTGHDDAPSATDREYGWREVLIAAAAQGAVFGVVKAATDRAGAVGYRKATGDWPED